MSEIQSGPSERALSWVDRLSRESLSEMTRDEELAWYSYYVDAVVPEENIQQVGFGRMEKVMDQEAFEKFVSLKQEVLKNEV